MNFPLVSIKFFFLLLIHSEIHIKQYKLWIHCVSVFVSSLSLDTKFKACSCKAIAEDTRALKIQKMAEHSNSTFGTWELL